jgi:hypothetical protein
MRNFANNFEEIIIQRGLYRVWMPLREGNRERLVSIWIDPTMRVFESQEESQTSNATQEHTTASDGDAQTVEETEGQCIRAARMGAPPWPSQRFPIAVTVH